ncbi:MAG: Ig-like domain-containing protein [Dehalococcoidia bacterium]|nr:Ig-like domain-containing protein [Pseudomonas sp. WS 5086]NMX92470.1 hypothetical protein [Pseudomonas sp. WS 5086]
MKIRRKLVRAATFGAFLLSFSGAVFAAPLKENSADIQQVIDVPGMAIVINAGGSGCNKGRHEVWEPTQNGCSNIEWVKKTARVVSLTASPPTIVANNSATSTLLATLKDGDGYLVGPGIPTSWGTTRGSLSRTSTVTNSSGQTSVTLRGTAAGVGTVTAAAVNGSASTNVTLTADPSTSRVISLAAGAASAPSNWTAIGLYATVRDAYNNILPAGQAVLWAATLGTLNTGTSYTDESGVAYASIASGTPGESSVFAKTTVSDNATTGIDFTNPGPTITSINLTRSTYYENYDSEASLMSWSGTGFTGATTFRVTVVDANPAKQQHFIGPSSFTPNAGATSWWLNSYAQRKKAAKEAIPYPYSGTARVTLEACNGGACSTASTTFAVGFDNTGSN